MNIEKGFKGSRLSIKTPEAEIWALGTKFAVESARRNALATRVGVFEGKVRVEGLMRIAKASVPGQEVVVKAGQKTEVAQGANPLTPVRLALDEWRELEELYQIGVKPQLLFLVKNTLARTLDILRPAPFYISSAEAKRLPSEFETAIGQIDKAIKSKDRAEHLRALGSLKTVAEKYADRPFSPQLLVFIGVYYRNIGHYSDAIATLEEVVMRYPESTFASIAQCAIGIIYEEDVKDLRMAKEAYEIVLHQYPDSLEALWIESNKNLSSPAARIA